MLTFLLLFLFLLFFKIIFTIQDDDVLCFSLVYINYKYTLQQQTGYVLNGNELNFVTGNPWQGHLACMCPVHFQLMWRNRTSILQGNSCQSVGLWCVPITRGQPWNTWTRLASHGHGIWLEICSKLGSWVSTEVLASQLWGNIFLLTFVKELNVDTLSWNGLIVYFSELVT